MYKIPPYEIDLVQLELTRTAPGEWYLAVTYYDEEGNDERVDVAFSETFPAVFHRSLEGRRRMEARSLLHSLRWLIEPRLEERLKRCGLTV